MSNQKLKNFKKELKSLLIKYDCSIDFLMSDCSDTHGIYNAGMGVSFDDKEFRLNDEYHINSHDL